MKSWKEIVIEKEMNLETQKFEISFNTNSKQYSLFVGTLKEVVKQLQKMFDASIAFNIKGDSSTIIDELNIGSEFDLSNKKNVPLQGAEKKTMRNIIVFVEPVRKTKKSGMAKSKNWALFKSTDFGEPKLLPIQKNR